MAPGAEELAYSEVLHPGTTYRILFLFVVPAQLPAQSCSHRCENFKVQDEHLQLPPSLSDETGPSNQTMPAKVTIEYSINFRLYEELLKGKDGEQSRPTKRLLQLGSLPLYIVPTRKERAPEFVPGHGPECCQLGYDQLSPSPSSHHYYKWQGTKPIRKYRGLGMRLGRLSASASQPPAIHLVRGDKQSATETIIKLDLEYANSEKNHSASSIFPPNILADFTIESLTFFGCDEWHSFPEHVHPQYRHNNQGVNVTKTASHKRDDLRVKWQWQREEEESTSHRYTASVEKRVSLPKPPAGVDDIALVHTPSFHSCLVSRIYLLKIKLCCSVGSGSGKLGSFSGLSLAVPLQICAE